MEPRSGRRSKVASGIAAIALAALLAWLLFGGGGVEAPPPLGPDAPAPAREASPSPPPADVPIATAEAPDSPAEADPPPPPPEEAPPGLPLRLVVRDGTTGEPIAGASLVLLGRDKGKGRHPLRAVGTDHFLDPSPLRPGEEVGYAVEAALPEGWVKEQPHHLWLGGGSVGLKAERVEASLLVWPEARVRVRVEEADGRPVAGARVQQIRSGNLERSDRTWEPTDHRGETVVGGLPAIPGENVRVNVGEGRRGAVSDPVPIGDRRDEVLVRVVLPAEVPPEPEFPLDGLGAVDVGGSVGEPLQGRGGARRPPPPPGSLLVRLSRSDGTPAAGVGLYSAGTRERADAQGAVRFASVPAGEQWVMSADVGFYLEPARVEIASGAETVLDLRESAQVDVEVFVFDADGAPVRGALLDARAGGNAPVCVIEGGAQQLGIFTGPEGRRALAGIPVPGWITAHLGTRGAAAEVLGGGPVVIRLPPAK